MVSTLSTLTAFKPIIQDLERRYPGLSSFASLTCEMLEPVLAMTGWVDSMERYYEMTAERRLRTAILLQAMFTYMQRHHWPEAPQQMLMYDEDFPQRIRHQIYDETLKRKFKELVVSGRAVGGIALQALREQVATGDESELDWVVAYLRKLSLPCGQCLHHAKASKCPYGQNVCFTKDNGPCHKPATTPEHAPVIVATLEDLRKSKQIAKEKCFCLEASRPLSRTRLDCCQNLRKVIKYRWSSYDSLFEDIYPLSFSGATLCYLPLAWWGKRMLISQERSTHIHHTPHVDAQAMSLFESLPDALVAVDTGWRITGLNQQAASLVQRRREEVLGKPLWEAFPEALGTACEQHYQQALHTQVAVRFEVWYPPLDMWFQVTASPSHQGLLLFFQEMTRRKHEAEAQWRLAALVESSDDAIIGHTLDGIITSWNAGAQRLYSYRPEEALGQPIAMLAPPERPDEIPRLLDLLKQGRRIDQYETERVCKDGTRLTVSITLSPIKDASGHIIGASSIARDLTERKRIEEALRERDVLVRTLLQHYPNGSVTIFDPDLRCLLAEGTGLEAVGLSPQRLVGKTLAELFPPEAVDYVTPHYRRAFAGELVQFECAFGGHVYTIDAAPLSNQEGTIAAIIVVEQDITARKRAEEALRASEHLSQAILDSLTTNIAVLNPAGTIIAVNEAWRRFARDNSPPGSLVGTEVGTNYLEVCRKARGAFAEEAQEALAGILAVLHGPHPHFTLEYPCHSPAEQRWFLMSATPLPAGEGAVVAHLNITERKRAEEAVRASEVRARRLLESNLIGVVVADREHILEANEAFLEMVGYTREDLDHHCLNWSAMTPAEYAPLDQRGLQELRERGVCTPFEKEYYRKDGSRVPILIGAVTLQEQPVQWACFILDISERKELERRKDEFISIASHELKTPITILKGFAQLIQRRLEKQGKSELVQYLGPMQTQLNTLTRLVNELLDVAKIQAGRLDYAQETVDLDALVQEVVELLQQTTATHSIRLSGASHAHIVGDRDRLSQVFTNLLTNAIKYSPQAKDVDVQIIPSAETVTVSVRDYGVGIPRAQQGKIFERFYRVQDYHDKTFPGLGMGLYISQQIVDRHGGKLWVVSEEGQGATFSVTLPFPHTEGAAEARVAMNPHGSDLRKGE